ncbi:tRNA N6-adenosine(37)-threonylcarbamoyltransferase complex transferase subunit TsaD [Anoxybacter fermentans]|uniref:tRNA N6-adenosine threonylcarbamoyltransferase n=1 Tax=Anoxybacter fermentans TaxID=1323375 RepID=A0A3Q9HSN1_9FIRM|nr:tRNA (adenosine(37)-N6)-threonylcarbamoyltransferase complex transferase subunit TsaD [Anoxybacter fermentans]AZR74761.1 tRNA N6-adenosine(37)-threonylcarbamoyltransferase complex transferase subunit TsaD [Anoxybacter fermentans]
MKEDVYILGIETSCDETSAAVVKNGRKILSNVIASQVDWHQKFGGVVPEIASRKHVELINPVIKEAIEKAGIEWSDLDGVAVTYGPGLVGGLLVGISAAKAIAMALDIPLIPVNHLAGHIYANFLTGEKIEPPVVCLTVSGGHTDLLYFNDLSSYQILGRTRDDAAGEAFDKIARVLKLGYPGGPRIEKIAREGNEFAVDLPRPLADQDDYDFSFSGLKTAVLNYINQLKQKNQEVPIADLAASFQRAVIDILITKILKAVEEKRVKNVILSGGVAANGRFRELLKEKLNSMGVGLYYPPPILCTDNGAMIASVGYFLLKKGEVCGMDLNAVPNLRL